MSTRMIALPEVEKKVGLKKSAIYDRIKTEGFPEPVKFGHVSRWVESEVDQWLKDYIEKYRDAG